MKAYEFELETRSEAGPSTSQPTKSLAATTSEQCSPSKSTEQISNDAMSLFINKPGHFAADCKKPNKDDRSKMKFSSDI
ncbi:zinc finger CCHC domain-containing protein 7-like [Dorcoceras hygrometricum]|uniref:Zinc finger CCHC domain-containing protein 7-like n=1 Tax=Dorcoceras hygrometricum TaxID=472368 RepID=A0A2Z6ZZF9_9LAMI|nr:zinc finger CCHC domain-containing protein 7-like [Dorcoceras hygrometricum]